MSTITDAAVAAIQDSVKTAPVSAKDTEFLTRQVFLPPAEKQAETLKVNTLQGLVDHTLSALDTEIYTANDFAIHILNPQTVNVIGGLHGRHRQRDTFLTAQIPDAVTANALGFKLNEFLDLEMVNIGLQCLFTPYGDHEAVLKVIGNVKDETVAEFGDDGVSQSVVAKTGLARVGAVEVPNPVNLAGYRSFAEIEQATGTFVLRMKQNPQGGKPLAALFEADGGRWKLLAIERIKAFLEVKLDGVPVIA